MVGGIAPSVRTSASVRRRLASMVYESLLILAVLFCASLLFRGAALDPLTEPLRHLYQAYLFVVLGLYFVVCWHRGGQTLPMKTWRIRVMRADGTALSVSRAALRYLLAWPCIGLAGAGIFWALIDPDRRFLHDRLAGTKIVYSGA